MIANSFALQGAFYLALFFAFWCFLGFLSRRWEIERNWSDVVSDWVVMLCALLIVIGVWLAAIHDSQFRPHRITQSINGHVLSQFWATNPAHIEWQTRQVVGTNGLEYRQFPVTNYWWSQWSLFKK
jgi:hypothetical protein